MELKRLADNQLIAARVVEAKSFCQRAVGLLGKSDWPSDRTLWIHDCNSIHTFFMKFTIDVVFVDAELKVTKICRGVRPGRMTWPDFKAKSVFEFSSVHGQAQTLQPGDKLHVGG
jgi:uncharacterized membrane protein (UPF0127 family)